jgi:hypothetical protein
MNNSNSSWSCTTTVVYGCIPFDNPSPDINPPWYPWPQVEPFNPNPYPAPFTPAPFVPVSPYTWPPKTSEQRISELEQRCAMLEKRLTDMEERQSAPAEVSKSEPEKLFMIGVKPHEPAQLPCTCDDLPGPQALHWEGCPAGRDHRSHNDGLEFLRAWIDGHFGKLELDSPTLFKIKQMIDAIGPKMRRRNSIDNY